MTSNPKLIEICSLFDKICTYKDAKPTELVSQLQQLIEECYYDFSDTLTFKECQSTSHAKAMSL